MSVLLVCLPADRLTEAQLAQVSAAAPGMRVVKTTERAVIEEMLDNIEIAVGSFPHDLLPRARNLRCCRNGARAWIGCCAIPK